jgi:DNA-binding GntR family transcriptional regulator
LAALEEELLRLAALPHDQAWDQRARDVDTRLHGLIAASCGSRRLAAEIDRYLTLFRSLRDVSHQRDAWTSYSRSNDVPEHLAIVVALRASDAEEAARAMDRHIRSAARTLEEVIFSSPDASAAGPAGPGGPDPLHHPPTVGPRGAIDNQQAGRDGRAGP